MADGAQLSSSKETLGMAATVALVATVALFVVSVANSASLDVNFVAYLLLLAALAVGVGTRLIASSSALGSDRAFRQALRPPASRLARPEAIQALARQLTFAMGSADDLHYRLRPLLQELARQRLAARRNVSLYEQPQRAAAALGPVAWALLNPARPRPRDRHGHGADLGTLTAVIAALEEI